MARMRWCRRRRCCFGSSLERSARSGVPRSRIAPRRQCGNVSFAWPGSVPRLFARASGRQRTWIFRHRWASSSRCAGRLRRCSMTRCASRWHGFPTSSGHGRIRQSGLLLARLGTGDCTAWTIGDCARCSLRSTARCSIASPRARRWIFRWCAHCRPRSGPSRRAGRSLRIPCDQRSQRPLALWGFPMTSRTFPVLDQQAGVMAASGWLVVPTHAAALARLGRCKGESEGSRVGMVFDGRARG